MIEQSALHDTLDDDALFVLTKPFRLLQGANGVTPSRTAHVPAQERAPIARACDSLHHCGEKTRLIDGPTEAPNSRLDEKQTIIWRASDRQSM